ncbi:MAG TPA: hypothetical protein K8V47_08870 [Candidatus Amulumruptor caecigallinarius]|uniref:Uncharacterized protein n=1 Tax=Candidatus Amulumruptor caecigallinarius TaxID=2109911 RepID=A0A921JIT3_9BACT|nr:hypothetical protein [Candidatus Amulumruptor caecigallinarius]
MGFWSFIRDMFVFDWLFGHRKKDFGSHHQNDCRHNNYSHNDDYHSTNYGGYHRNDYAQQDFDDDLESGMFDDDF